MAQSKPLALVAGAGSGLGQSLLARFSTDGYTAVGLGRSMPNTQIGSFYQVDLADPQRAQDVLSDVIEQHGVPEVVVHNTAELVISPFNETRLEDFQTTWASMVQTAVVLGQATLPLMAKKERGAFLVSGATASVRGSAKFSAFASAKFALRGLTQSLAREYNHQGVHVAHILLDGIIDTERSRDLHSLDPARMMRPEDIAEAYWQLVHQPRSTWTHELDLRPSSERF